MKSAIVQVDATPFRQWWEGHYGQALGKKRVGAKDKEGAAPTTTTAEVKRSDHVQRKIASRKDLAHVDSQLDDQFSAGRLYALITSRPGQSGRCDGYILEGKELEFYLRKIRSKK